MGNHTKWPVQCFLFYLAFFNNTFEHYWTEHLQKQKKNMEQGRQVVVFIYLFYLFYSFIHSNFQFLSSFIMLSFAFLSEWNL